MRCCSNSNEEAPPTSVIMHCFKHLYFGEVGSSCLVCAQHFGLEIMVFCVCKVNPNSEKFPLFFLPFCHLNHYEKWTYYVLSFEDLRF